VSPYLLRGSNGWAGGRLAARLLVLIGDWGCHMPATGLEKRGASQRPRVETHWDSGGGDFT
jgi:hypothetical protein